MNDFISTLLQAVIIAAVPIVSAFLGKGIQAAARYLAAKTDNALAQKYLDEAAEAITTAVSQTNQTYVDALKQSGKFTIENQKEALNLAVERATNLLTQEATEFLAEAYGDLNSYLVSRIEAEVRRQKITEPTLLQEVRVCESTMETTIE